MQYVEEKNIGVVADDYNNVLRQFVRCTYNPVRKHYEAKGATRDHVLSYRTKSEARSHAVLMGLPQGNVVRYGNALDSVYAISLSVHSPDMLVAVF